MEREDWNRRWRERSSHFHCDDDPSGVMVAELGSLVPGRALDLACGAGRGAIWLAERGWQVTGVDFSKVGLDKARQLANARGVQAEWILADLLDYRPEPQAFGLVIVFYLQLPGAQRPAILKAAAGAVAPGGTFLLVAHDSSNLTEGHGGPQDAAVLYTAHDVSQDLNEAGLRVERAERVQRPVQTAEGERIALDALFRASRSQVQ